MSSFSGAGLTYRQRTGAGRRPRGAGLTYRKPYGAGAMDPVVAPLAEGDIAGAALGIGGIALSLLAQYYIIKYAVRAAGKRR